MARRLWDNSKTWWVACTKMLPANLGYRNICASSPALFQFPTKLWSADLKSLGGGGEWACICPKEKTVIYPSYLLDQSISRELSGSRNEEWEDNPQGLDNFPAAMKSMHAIARCNFPGCNFVLHKGHKNFHGCKECCHGSLSPYFAIEFCWVFS